MQPNILFVFADQLRYSALACNGNHVVRTPNLDRLAREGVVFDQAFSSCPICSPYRAQVLTGRYSHANGVIDNEYALFEGETTIAHVLRESGYRTAYVGKWHLGYPPYAEPARYGFDDLYAYNCTHRYYDVSYWHNDRGPFRMEGFAPEVETELTLDHIGAHTQDHPQQPFCVFLSWGRHTGALSTVAATMASIRSSMAFMILSRSTCRATYRDSSRSLPGGRSPTIARW